MKNKINFYVNNNSIDKNNLWNEWYVKNKSHTYFYSYIHWADLLNVNYEIKNIDDEVIDGENNWYVLDLEGRVAIADIFNFIIEKKLLNFIHKNENLKLMIFLPQEGMYIQDQPFWYVTFCEKNNIPLERLYILQLAFWDFNHPTALQFLNNGRVEKCNIDKVSKINWIVNKFSSMFFWTLLFHTYSSYRYIPTDNLQYKKRNKYFTFLSMSLTYGGDSYEVKFYRLYPLAKLHSDGILNKGYYSLISRMNDSWRFDSDSNRLFDKYGEETFKSSLSKMIRKLPTDSDIFKPLDKNRKDKLLKSFNKNLSRIKHEDEENILDSAKKLLDLVPTYLSSENDEKYLKQFIYPLDPFGVNSGDFNLIIPKSEIEDSYFFVVVGSAFNATLMYSDEKQAKPLLQLQPFILLSSPGHLSFLRSMGYETFPELFDESYDEIEDSFERIEFICKEIKRVCNMSIEELHEIYVSIFPKLVRNRERFLSNNLKNIFEEWFS